MADFGISSIKTRVRLVQCYFIYDALLFIRQLHNVSIKTSIFLAYLLLQNAHRMVKKRVLVLVL
jgi:hypothetical protein